MRFPNLLSVLLIGLVALNYYAPFGDLDFAWQIRTGERIVQTGSLQPVEAFSYTIEGSQVPDFEWLYEVILYLVYSGFGFGGLKFLRVVLVAAPLIIVALHLRRQGVRWHAIALAILVAVYILSPAWNLRPLFCSITGMVLVTCWLHDHCTGRRPLSWWLPVVMLLWTNLHPAVIAGQGLLFMVISWEWLNRWVKLNQPLDAGALRRLTVIGGLGFLATFIGPDPIARLLYPFKAELRHPIQQVFMEMRPLVSFLGTPPFVAVVAYSVAALVLVTIILRFRQYRLWEVSLIVGLGGLANMAVRSLQDWVLVMLALGVPHMAILLARAARTARRQPGVNFLLRLDRSCKRLLFSPILRFQPLWPAIVVIVLFLVSFFPPTAHSMPKQNATDWPVAALDYIQSQDLQGRFFSPPDYGSYLGWRRGDKAKIYTDTRGFYFPPLLLEDSHYLPQLDSAWPERVRRVLDEYHTDYFLLETTGGRAALWQDMQPHIAQPLYLDDQAVLLSAGQVRQWLKHKQVASLLKEPQVDAERKLRKGIEVGMEYDQVMQKLEGELWLLRMEGQVLQLLLLSNDSDELRNVAVFYFDEDLRVERMKMVDLSPPR